MLVSLLLTAENGLTKSDKPALPERVLSFLKLMLPHLNLIASNIYKKNLCQRLGRNGLICSSSKRLDSSNSLLNASCAILGMFS